VNLCWGPNCGFKMDILSVEECPVVPGQGVGSTVNCVLRLEYCVSDFGTDPLALWALAVLSLNLHCTLACKISTSCFKVHSHLYLAA
jgi:hypothetical protein